MYLLLRMRLQKVYITKSHQKELEPCTYNYLTLNQNTSSASPRSSKVFLVHDLETTLKMKVGLWIWRRFIQPLFKNTTTRKCKSKLPALYFPVISSSLWPFLLILPPCGIGGYQLYGRDLGLEVLVPRQSWWKSCRVIPQRIPLGFGTGFAATCCL